jgi:hypothetical protein
VGVGLGLGAGLELVGELDGVDELLGAGVEVDDDGDGEPDVWDGLGECGRGVP